MSHRSTPRKPRARSPSCQEEGENGELEGQFRSVCDEMEMGDEFDSSLGLLKTTSNLVAHTRGSRTCDRNPVRNVSFSSSATRSPSGSLKGSNCLQVPPFNTQSPSASRNLGNTQPGQHYMIKRPIFDGALDCDPPVTDFGSDDCLRDPDETVYMDVVMNCTPRDNNRTHVSLNTSRQQCNDTRTTIAPTVCPEPNDAVGSTPSKCYSPCARTPAGTVRPESYGRAGRQQLGYNDGDPLNDTCGSDSRRYPNEREDDVCGVNTSRVSSRSPARGPRDNLCQTLGQSVCHQDDTCRSDSRRYQEDGVCGVDTSRVSARSPARGPRDNLSQTLGQSVCHQDDTCRSDSRRYPKEREDGVCGVNTSRVSSRSPARGPRDNLSQTLGQSGCHQDDTCRSDSRKFLMEREDGVCGVDTSRVSARSPARGPRDNLSQTFGPSVSPQDHQVHHGGHRIPFNRTQSDQGSFVRSPQTPADEHSLHHHDRRVDGEPRRDERAVAALAHLSQLNKTPSYKTCGVNQSADYLSTTCSPKAGKSNKLPEMPCLETGELMELIRSERQDVESVRYLTSEEKTLYKKPCPKQQKAQMNVAAIMKGPKGQTCGEKYTPLEHPDPDDISPEVAANMMFSQEKGIRMDGCPKEIITHLFPDEVKQSFPEKIQRSSISVVDPNQKDREVMIEKSAGVPSEGVSDSAYTRTMKEKGEELVAQKSYDVDFAIGQSKREYVLVAQKPQRFNKVQFRGANLPSWFPGYFCAFPDEDGIKETSSPSELFHKAWIHANPKNMPPNDVIVLD